MSDQNFDDVLDLLLVNDHYVLIKDFNRLMLNKNKSKNKKWFCKSCLCCFSSEKVLLEHKKNCFLINGGQNVKLENGLIEFNNFNKMIPAPLILELIMIVLVILQNIKTIFLVALLINLFV